MYTSRRIDREIEFSIPVVSDELVAFKGINAATQTKILVWLIFLKYG